jgi:hypothetical protein
MDYGKCIHLSVLLRYSISALRWPKMTMSPRVLA